MTRVLGFIVHNWPLKLGAIALASLLYGLLLSQTTESFTSPVRIEIANAPSDVIVLSNPGSVTRIRYVAPAGLGLRIDSDTFRASVDLADVDPTGRTVTLDVTVEAVDPRVQVLDYEPGAIVLTIDRVGTKTVPIRAVLGPIPSGLEAGDPQVEGESAVVSGPQSIVAGVTEAQARIALDGTGIDIDQQVSLVAVTGDGTELGVDSRVEVEPARVRVRVPIFTDRRSKSLPVTPTVVGTPAAGFEVAGVEIDPTVVSVEGDANDLASLERADTEPVSVAGASSVVTQVVGLALPDGVQPLGPSQVQVTVRLRPITGTRIFDAGLVLVGDRADRTYTLSTDRVNVVIGGTAADLDRLSGSTLVLTVDVTGLDVGTYTVSVSANLTTGLTLVDASPNPIEVTIAGPSASPAPSPGASPTT